MGDVVDFPERPSQPPGPARRPRPVFQVIYPRPWYVLTLLEKQIIQDYVREMFLALGGPECIKPVEKIDDMEPADGMCLLTTGPTHVFTWEL